MALHTNGKKKSKHRSWTPLDLSGILVEDDGTGVPLRNVHTIVANLTPTVALDCEMVGVGNGKPLRLARVSVVAADRKLILDLYVRPERPVTRYYEHLNGITERHMRIAIPHLAAVEEVRTILAGRHLIGHSINGDLKVIFGDDPWPIGMTTTDIADYRPLWKIVRPTAPSQRPGLAQMAEVLLGQTIQQGAHSSIEDARAALDIYTRCKDVFDDYGQ